MAQKPVSEVIKENNSLFGTLVQYNATYNIEEQNYYVYPMVNNTIVGEPLILTEEEYLEFILELNSSEYFKEKAKITSIPQEELPEGTTSKPWLEPIVINNPIFETIFGGGKIELKPRGFASFDLGVLSQKIDNPQILPQNRQSFAIDIQQRIQLSLLGKIGKNFDININQDTQASFNFQNKLNLGWQGDEDKIVQNVEFGNVSLPLSTSLIQGAQALFGVKADFKFGNTNITTVFSEQQSEARNITVQGGNLVNTFKVFAIDYEDNQHYFLNQYFRNHYDEALLEYPLINSRINITRLEVWKIDLGNSSLQDQRQVLAVRDLAESDTDALPDNFETDPTSIYSSVSNLANIRDISLSYSAINNTVLPSFFESDVITNDGVEEYKDGENFALKRARKLTTNEFSFNPQLGYVSLNQRLPEDQLLAVSYEYTINGSSQIFKVGEFSTDEDEVLITKMLKSNSLVNVNSPSWDLMMKNVYSIEGNQVAQDNFFLNVYYRDNIEGQVPYLPNTSVQDQRLVELLNWGRLNLNGDAIDTTSGQTGDGLFDFINGVTINPQNGKVYFTKVEPFGNYMEGVLTADPPDIVDQYVYNELYDQIKADADLDELSRYYYLEGRFQGALGGSGIPLGALNVPRGSVNVTSGGAVLQEGVDYIVDYQLGRVNIINQTIKDSGQAINISIENQSTFNLQKKNFAGINIEHTFSDKFRIGATAINYNERPHTQKVQYGSESVNNTVFGINAQYNTESAFLTRLTDKIPLINTNVPSNISLNVEGAYLLPGQNNATDNQSYIDDFDDTASKISLTDPNSWSLGSIPESFGNGSDFNNTTGGYFRSLSSWYNIDPSFYGVGSNTIDGITNISTSTHRTRRIRVNEIFTNRDFIAGEPLFMNTFDFTIYPEDAGPYNINSATENPEDRFAVLQRSLNVSNFREANIENVEFWVMDPYGDGLNAGDLGVNPELTLHLGNVSEDILRDGNLLYENGLNFSGSTNPETISNWGISPQNAPIIYTFETEGAQREEQDTGYDGLVDQDELTFYPTAPSFINPITGANDISKDNFLSYQDDLWASSTSAQSITDRYKYFRNPQNNSPSGTLNAATTQPNSEDTNRDYNLDQTESFNEYKISLRQQDLELGSNFIVDVKEVDGNFTTAAPGIPNTVKWYLFRVPVSQFTNGSTSVLTNVRYMRMIMQGFSRDATLRFGTLDLVRTDWRRYAKNISPAIPEGSGTPDISNFDIGLVDLETNGRGTPPYVVPPGIFREELGQNGGVQSQNEGSIFMRMNGATTRDSSRGAYKYLSLDLRRYEQMDMFVHAEELNSLGANTNSNEYDEDAKFFIRLGSDLSDNYYEYEISLRFTPSTSTTESEIWPNENTISLATDLFKQAKLERDANGVNIQDRYENFDTGDITNKKIIVKGRPTLGNITAVMIGIRDNDVSNPRSLLVWANELRLSGIDNEGGYASTASLNVNLGDFADINLNGNFQSIGYGAIDRGPSERSQSDTYSYSLNTAVNLDKFLPEKWGVKLPFTYSISEQFEDPKFNPLDNDIELDDAVNREQIKDQVTTYQKQRTIAFPNISKTKTGNSKPKFYDIENISMSFLFSDRFYRDIYTANNLNQNLNISANYSYNSQSKYIEPFKKLGFVQDTAKLAKYFVWLKETNINPVPTSVSFRSDVVRNYQELLFRDINGLLNGTPNTFSTAFSNKFVLGWQYDIGFNLTRSLRINYGSSTRTLVDDVSTNVPDNSLIFSNLFNVGRPISYNQNLQINYRLPFQYLPYLDFINTELSYTAQYDWQASSTALTQQVDDNLGNNSQNSNTKNVTSNVNFETLFRKFKGFRKMDSIRMGRKREIDSLDRTFAKLYTPKKKKNKKYKKYKFKNKFKTKDYFWQFASMFRRGNLSYTENSGTVLPGFLLEPNFFGTGTASNSSSGPTFGFLFGSQSDLRRRAITEGWISNSDLLNDPFSQNTKRTLTMSLNLVPLKNLNINLNARRNFQRTRQQFGYNVNLNSYVNETANFNSSILSLKTSFKDNDDVFNDILDNASILSFRLANERSSSLAQIGISDPVTDLDNNGFADGYDITNSEVLIPSFYSAFTGQNPNKTSLNYKKGFPLPNWTLTYDGLKNIPIINRYVENVQLSHNYSSNYTVTGVQSNLEYFNNSTGLDNNLNRFNPFVFGSVAIIESFSPLIGADITLRNQWQIRANINRDRFSILSLTNYTFQEDTSTEFVLGAGYVWKNRKIKMRYQGNIKTITTDINFRLDLALKDNETKIRRLLENDSQITGGQNLFSIRFAADANLGKNFNVRLFYDQQVTKYKISTAFPLSVTRAGISATFNFGN